MLEENVSTGRGFGIHHADTFAKGGRKLEENVHSWDKPLPKSIIGILGPGK
jgi:hypothetical protein